MKITSSFLLLSLCLTLTNCAQQVKTGNHFVLEGRITDQDSGTIILQYGILSAFRSDTTKIMSGKFKFEGILEEPTLVLLKVDGQSDRINLYLEPGLMKINMSKNNFMNFKLTGSKTQDDIENFNKSLGSASNQDSAMIHFVSKNPGSYITPHFLEDLGYRNVISSDSLKVFYNQTDPSVQRSKYGRIIMGMIRRTENTTPGNFATDFNAADINNQPLTLSQFRNEKVVLLDFWASTCAPCRAGFPHLKALFKRYHTSGLEIIAIAVMDKNRVAWETAIKDDSISAWHHIATYFQDGISTNEDITFDYPTGPIPRTILIDKGGKVVGNWVGHDKENESSIDHTLEMLFKK